MCFCDLKKPGEEDEASEYILGLDKSWEHIIQSKKKSQNANI